MKQVYLWPRGAMRTPLRSDTLFGLIAWGVRMVFGRRSLERFLEPALRDPPAAPLAVTSAFPCADGPDGRLHFFPRPLDGTEAGPAARYIDDREFLAFVAGRAPVEGADAAETVRPAEGFRDGAPSFVQQRGGLFFLAAGPGEHVVEPAVLFLERFGFGGDASSGQGAFDVEVREAEFVRLAQPGERGLLLSLCHPRAEERRSLAAAVAAGERLSWAFERRSGFAGGRLAAAGAFAPPRKRALAMLREGSVLRRPEGAAFGSAPVVSTGRDADGDFPVVQHGFGFLVPVAAGVESGGKP